MSTTTTTTTTTTTRDRGDCYGPMEWAQLCRSKVIQFESYYRRGPYVRTHRHTPRPDRSQYVACVGRVVMVLYVFSGSNTADEAHARNERLPHAVDETCDFYHLARGAAGVSAGARWLLALWCRRQRKSQLYTTRRVLSATGHSSWRRVHTVCKIQSGRFNSSRALKIWGSSVLYLLRYLVWYVDLCRLVAILESVAKCRRVE